MRTILVFGDQLSRRIGALADSAARRSTILLVESEELLRRGHHRQRLHLVITAMRRFAAELRGDGYDVDVRRAATMAAGLDRHIAERRPDEVVAAAPNSRAARDWCERHGVRTVSSNQFLCSHEDFAAWARGRSRVRMEDFYRWHRTRLGYLMEPDGSPAGDRWNLDAENRQPPPTDLSVFSAPVRSRLDDIDRDVVAGLPHTHGDAPDGTWATTRRGALARLSRFLEHELVRFGPYEDAMAAHSWHLAHSLLSAYLNIGLLLPRDVLDAVEDAYRSGGVPLQSAEGIVRQIIGWREYVWGLYWLWPEHADSNALGHDADVPPAFTGRAHTDMVCVGTALTGLRERAWVHHIQRLMVLANLCNLYGVHPRRVVAWMSSQYIDAAEWVMIPNVMGMAMWADGGRMATKPYVAGGAYINRMSDYCRHCRYRPSQRTGEDACPFTTLYWDFLARHRSTLRRSHRMDQPLRNLDRLADLPAVRARAVTVRQALRDGTC